MDAGAIPETELEARLREFAVLGRHYGCLPAVDSGEGRTDAALEAIARATVGRVNYRVSMGAGDAGENAQYLNRIAEVLLG